MAPVLPYKIVMVRHGESDWNEKNLFCGWYDSNLSQRGIDESINAGKILKKFGFKFDIAYTSLLSRAQNTLQTILIEIGQEDLPIVKTWRLNEAHCGALTGLNKQDAIAKYGEKEVAIWRHSFDVPPPPMEPDHPYYKTIMKDPRYLQKGQGPSPDQFPKFESPKLTIERTIPYWNDTIIPLMKTGRKIIIVAHTNSLRAIVKHLDNLSDEEIMHIHFPTGTPFEYILDPKLNVIPGGSLQYLTEPELVRKSEVHLVKHPKAN